MVIDRQNQVNTESVRGQQLKVLTAWHIQFRAFIFAYMGYCKIWLVPCSLLATEVLIAIKDAGA